MRRIVAVAIILKSRGRRCSLSAGYLPIAPSVPYGGAVTAIVYAYPYEAHNCIFPGRNDSRDDIYVSQLYGSLVTGQSAYASPMRAAWAILYYKDID
jgi:hypothetical protein